MTKGQQVLGTDGALAVRASLADLTSAAGTPAAGTVDVTSTPTQSTINNNFATLVQRINALTAALRDAGIIAN
ncbi:hypothetical protein [Streptomyces cyanogenus]|uniref:Head fiber protein n=1 Tax=Streptomyces cyanogenus TaxID=80860 RepID=A0ABX7TJY0_STRCY|nr:hypothetical protein [Streptomyces cyanogenus]QTD96977.1 hypothetical protein S1361_06410 [Streptomyces cyanogenus]